VPFGGEGALGDDDRFIIWSLPWARICIKAQIHVGASQAGYFKNSLGYRGVKIVHSQEKAVDLV
jgi:hypothetical protein